MSLLTVKQSCHALPLRLLFHQKSFLTNSRLLIFCRNNEEANGRPLSTLSSQDKILLSTASRNKIILVLPHRFFGRNKRLPPYGHGYEDKMGPFSKVILFTLVGLFFIAFIDWRRAYEEYGIRIPIVTDYALKIVVPKNDYSVPSSAPLIFEERKREIHEYMQEEAAKRALENAKTDPEMLAIIEGKEIEVKDPDAFAIKLDYIKTLRNKLSVKAEELSSASEERDRMDFRKLMKAVAYDDDDDDDDDEDGEGGAMDKKVGFRNRKIIEYENRIRHYSTPDKIFRYFATYRMTDEKGHLEAMMTPDDFLRSITPGMKQPENLGLDQFITVTGDEVTRLSSQWGLEDGSIFHQLGSGGLISFSDYIFLLTVLSTSRRHFEIAFKMFDLNGDGNVDAKEFEVVTNLMKSQSSTGIRHRDHQTTGSTFKGINSGLNNYFFGHDREGILTVEKFLDFQRRLQNEIIRLEFNRKWKESHSSRKSDGQTIPEKDFAELLITYAGFSSKKRARMIKRVRRAFGGQDSQGISLQDFLNFYQVLYAINDIDTALTFHTIAGAPIERHTMKHVAQTVAKVQLSDHIIDVVFILFDENGDGKLSNKEFVSVMKQRALRGLEKPKDTGLGRIFSAMTKCAAESRPAVIGGSRRTDMGQ